MDRQFVLQWVIVCFLVAEYRRHIAKSTHENPGTLRKRDILVPSLVFAAGFFQGQTKSMASQGPQVEGPEFAADGNWRRWPPLYSTSALRIDAIERG